jgi:hypothetical protein
MNEDEVKLVERFLDEEGRVKQLPSKQAPRDAVLKYLAEKFSSNTDYKEREVNAILMEWHTFNDYFILRRALASHDENAGRSSRPRQTSAM